MNQFSFFFIIGKKRTENVIVRCIKITTGYLIENINEEMNLSKVYSEVEYSKLRSGKNSSLY